MYTRVYVCMCAYVNIVMHVCLQVCMHLCDYVYDVCVNVPICNSMYSMYVCVHTLHTHIKIGTTHHLSKDFFMQL